MTLSQKKKEEKKGRKGEREVGKKGGREKRRGGEGELGRRKKGNGRGRKGEKEKKGRDKKDTIKPKQQTNKQTKLRRNLNAYHEVEKPPYCRVPPTL